MMLFYMKLFGKIIFETRKADVLEQQIYRYTLRERQDICGFEGMMI